MWRRKKITPADIQRAVEDVGWHDVQVTCWDFDPHVVRVICKGSKWNARGGTEVGAAVGRVREGCLSSSTLCRDVPVSAYGLRQILKASADMDDAIHKNYTDLLRLDMEGYAHVEYKDGRFRLGYSPPTKWAWGKDCLGLPGVDSITLVGKSLDTCMADLTRTLGRWL